MSIAELAEAAVDINMPANIALTSDFMAAP
jgi:hypothetical protein